MGERQNLFVALSKDELQEIIREAAEKGAETAVRRMSKTGRTEKTGRTDNKKKPDRRVHNTRLLLRNYRTLKEGCRNAVYQKAEDIETILDDIDSIDKDELVVEAIKRTASRTTVILAHIDKMLDLHRVYCNRHDPIYRRQHKVIMAMYINKNRKTRGELAEEYGVSTVTIHNDIKAATERISTLMFGVDGLKLD